MNLYHFTNHGAERYEERGIKPEWLKTTLVNPDLLLDDEEDLTKRHALRKIPEFGDRVLRVVYNWTTTPVGIISVHFDRRYRGKL